MTRPLPKPARRSDRSDVTPLPATAETVGQLLHAAWIAAEDTGLREEDRRKAIEVAALLNQLARVRRGAHLVDAAAGKAYVGLLAAKLLRVGRVTVLEREPERVRASREAAARLGVTERVDIVCADVASAEAWPAAVEAVAALHACGPAADAVIERASASRARWLFLVPCCYGAEVPAAAAAEAIAARWGIGRHPEVRRRLVHACVDIRRTLQLEAAGWEVTVVPLVPPTVTPHHLLWRSRRTNEPRRMQAAQKALQSLPGEAATAWTGAVSEKVQDEPAQPCRQQRGQTTRSDERRSRADSSSRTR